MFISYLLQFFSYAALKNKLKNLCSVPDRMQNDACNAVLVYTPTPI